MTISLAELRAALDVYVHQCDKQSGRIFTGRVSPEGARVFVQQWGLFTRHSRQCWANVVGNCPVVEARRFMVKENLYEEEADIKTSHFEKLARLGIRLGLSREQIEKAEPFPTTEAALLGWEALTRNRHWLEGLAAKAVLERVGFENDYRRTMVQQWMEDLHLNEQEAEFFLIHLTADQIHGEGAYEILARYAEPHDLDRIREAARQSLTLMSLYQNGIVAAMVPRPR